MNRRSSASRPTHAHVRALVLAVAFTMAASLFSAGARPSAAGQDALQPYVREAVIPAPGLDFVIGKDLNGDGLVDFAGLDANYRQATEEIDEFYLKGWLQERPPAGEPLGFRFSAKEGLATQPFDPDFTSMAVGDIDGDGNPDLLVYENGPLHVYLNEDGSGSFPDKSSGVRPIIGEATHVELANIDADSGDTRDDLIVVQEEQAIYWLPNETEDGVVRFGSQKRIASLSGGTRSIRRVSTGDINEDGLLDFVSAANARNGDIAFWHQEKSGDSRSFKRAGATRFNEVRDLTLVDIDEDGHLDILTSNQVGSQKYNVFAWLGAGDGETFERDPTSLYEGTSADHKHNSIDVADVDNDGKVDFILSEFTPGSNGGHLCWYHEPKEAEPPTSTATDAATATPTTTPTPVPIEPSLTPPSPSPTDTPGVTEPAPTDTLEPTEPPPVDTATPEVPEEDDTIYLPIAERP